MSQPNLAADLAAVVNQQVALHNALPPRFKNIARASMAASLITSSIYAAMWTKPVLGVTATKLVEICVYTPGRAPWQWWLPVALWSVAGVLGPVWLLVGVTGSRGPRDPMRIFWALFRVALLGGLLVYGLYLPREWFVANVILRGFYISYLAAAGVELLLLMHGPVRSPVSADTHGQAHTASIAHLQQEGIVR